MINYKNNILNRSVVLKATFFCIIISLPLFMHLGSLPLRIYDESRVALSAYEMHHNGNYLVTTIDGKPDMWSTKPPLLIWFQVLFIKIMGVSELTFRLPSAIAALLTCIALLGFSVKYLNSYWMGFIASIILVTSHGYINVHAARTGDYDSMLTLFMFASTITYFLYIEENNNKYLLITFFILTLAVLTKGIAGLLLTPALLIYTLFRKRTAEVLKNKLFYTGLLLFIFLSVGYYLIREYINPGYLNAVQENEWGGRYLKTTENHAQDILYYYDYIVKYNFKNWYLFIPCGLSCGFFMKDEKFKKLTCFLLICMISFLLIISFSKTKLEWYALPLYPFMALSAAIFIFFLFTFLIKSDILSQLLHKNVIPYLFLFLIAVGPYHEIIDIIYHQKEYPQDVEYYGVSYMLKKEIKKNEKTAQSYFVCSNIDFNAQLTFYSHVLNDKHITQVQQKSWDKLNASEIAVTAERKIKENIEHKYDIAILDNEQGATKYLILGNKQ